MARGTLSLLGIYKYTGDVLDDLALPDALEDDRQTIIDNLLMETAELEILYPDSWFLKQAIGAWSRKQMRVWQELYETTQYEYNPIWNKDGTYVEKEITKRDLTGNDELHGEVTGETKSETDTMHDVYGYNSEDAAHESSDSGKGLTNSFGTSKSTNDRKENEDVTRQLERTEQGNIGVTSTQSLIQEQRNVVLFNIIDYIIKDFKERFCIMVY